MRLRWSNVLALLVLLGGVAAAAPFVARWHWTLDLLACFAVQTMVALAAAGVLLAVLRRLRFAAAAGAFAALAAVAVLPGWLRVSEPASIGAAPGAGLGRASAELKLLSLNLLRGNEAGAPGALAAIAAFAPDVLVCSELTPAWLAALAPRLTELPHRCVRADDGFYGIAVFARWPLHDAEVIPLGVAWAPAVRATIATPGGPVGLLGVHTPRPGDARRGADRDRALAAIPAALAPLPPARIVVGDCNTTPWNPAFDDLLHAAALRNAADGSWRPTWPAHWPLPLRIPIDHVLVSAEVGVASTAVGAAYGSDHLPLAATLRLPRR